LTLAIELQPDGRSVSIQKRLSPTVEIDGSYELQLDTTSLKLNFLLSIRASDGRLQVTAMMPLEDYVAAVLAGEAATMRSGESLKAMAVAARTWAVRFRGRHGTFDFCDSTHCQWLRPGEVPSRFRDAATATEGGLLWYKGTPAATYYHQNCGGTTEDGRYLDAALRDDPYLHSHSDQFCLARDRGEWQTEVSKADLQRALASAGIPVKYDDADKLKVEVLSRTPSGRVLAVRVGGATVDAPRFRFAVDRNLGWDRLRSDAYEITDTGDHLVFHGRGEGHGVGLCQTGAAQMGEQGNDYREILEFYYPGTVLCLTAQGIRWQMLAGERIDMLTTRPAESQQLLEVAARALQEAEAATGWALSSRPQLKVYPTVAMFRDATGEPGWVAASTRGNVIRLQPPETLQRADALHSTLRHEFLHMLVEQHATPSVPLWFREGLVLYLTQAKSDRAKPASPAPGESSAELETKFRKPENREALQRAYADAQARVASLVAKFGLPTVLSWCEQGLPDNVE
jgi:stage II sporulation protein D